MPATLTRSDTPLKSTIRRGASRHQRSSLLGASFLVLIFAPSLRAQESVWSGASPTTGNWSDPANWSPGAPQMGDTVGFGASPRTTSLVDTDYSVASIIFGSGAPAHTVQISGAHRTLAITGDGVPNQS
ncbi:MAG: hypothetical protein WD490_05765, partial [Opitutales bacterium]